MICPNCKVIIPDSVEHCLKCHFPINENEQTERSVKEEKLKEMLICPKCGALHTPTAKVCRNDGTLLLKNEDIKELEPDDERKKKGIIGGKAFLSFFIAIAFLTILYIYASDRLAIEHKKEISDEKEFLLENKKIDTFFSEKEKRSPDPAFIEVEINRKLRRNGVEGVYVEVSEDYTATITGYFLTKLDRLKTFSLIESYKEISSVVDSTKRLSQKRQRISTSSLKSGINESLKDEGLNNLIVEVDDYFNVTIKGAVKNKKEKDRAFEIAKNFKDVRSIKDLIFIVEH